MQKRKLGKSGLEVSAIGLGCMGLRRLWSRPMKVQRAQICAKRGDGRHLLIGI